VTPCTCGATNEPESDFCERCGRPLGSTPPEHLPLRCPSCGRAYAAPSAYCDACGKPLVKPERARRLHLTDAEGHRLSIDGDREIGRADFAEWLPADRGRVISRRHFRIHHRTGEFLLDHVSLTNPTHINGVIVEQLLPLKEGDVIDLAQGALVLTVSLEQ